jgi:hypothetical protein
MSPWRKPQRNGKHRIPGYLVWRVMTVFAVLAASGALLLAPILFTEIRKSTDSSHALVCSLGDLVQLSTGDAPIRGSHSQLQAQLDFLTHIDEAKCPLIESHPRIHNEIHHSIDDLERRLAK